MFYVTCPYCDEDSTFWADGSYLWKTDWEIPSPSPCSQCGKEFLLPKRIDLQ